MMLISFAQDFLRYLAVMKTVALVLMAALAAVSGQQPVFPRPQPVFRVTASQPFQAVQRRPVVVQPLQARPIVAQPIQGQQAYYRRPLPVFRQDAAAPAIVPIVSQSDVRDEKGYTYSYETGDGTNVQERGLLKPGPEGDYIVAEGSFSFVGSDGVTYTITYKADENGFQPEGAHIPKVPA